MASGRFRGGLLAALLFLSAVAPAAPVAADDGARLTRPGLVLVDPLARRAALDDFAPGVAARLCRGNLFNPRARIPMLHDPGYLPGGGVDSRLLPLTAWVAEGTARAWAQDDLAALDSVTRMLRRWADAPAMAQWADDHPWTFFAVDRGLFPLLVSLSLIGDRLRPDDRAAITDWLAGQIARHDGPRRACFTCNEDALRYIRDAVDMAWAAFTGDEARFRRAVAGYQAALDGMTDTGELPIETAHHEMGLWSLNRALAPLVAMAAMADLQGLDLWSRSGRAGAGLHDAVGFMLGAIERIDAQGRIRPESLGEDRFPRTDQQAALLYPRPGGGHAMAWTVIYIARFPGHENTRRLRALFAGRRIVAREFLSDDMAGGNATCLFGGPVPLAE